MSTLLKAFAEAAAWLAVVTLAFVSPAVGSEPAASSSARTLDLPADYAPGEWWTVRIEDLYAGEFVLGTMVVTGVEGETVRFGLAEDSIHALMLNHHVLPVGLVPAESLRMMAHGSPFDPVRFPMQARQSWDTEIGGVPVTAFVESVDGVRAKVTFKHESHQMAAGIYDAALGWYSELEMAGMARMTVMHHGFGYGCDSVFPADLMPDYRARERALATEIFRQEPVHVPTDIDTAAITMRVGADDRGHTRLQAISPDGTMFELVATPGSGHRAMHMVAHEAGGNWNILTEIVGDAYASFSMAVFRAEAVGPFGDGGCGALDTSGVASGGQQAIAGGSLDPWSAGWRLALVAVAFLARHWRKAGWAALHLFTRLDGGTLADHPVRARILELLSAENGKTTQDLRRTLGIGWGTANYHLAVLERHGKLLHVRSGRRSAWVTHETPPAEIGKFAALSVPQTRRVYDAIVAMPGASQRELAKALALHPATVHHHVHGLTRAGAVATHTEGRRTRHYPT